MNFSLSLEFIMVKPHHLLSHIEAICKKKIYQFLKPLMNVERSFNVNCLFATFIKHSTGTFTNVFLMFQEYYF